jgi:hypothetical protein
MSSTKLWSKSKTSNKITSHGEDLVETEYSLRNYYCSVRASDKVWWVMDLSHVQELQKYVRVLGSPPLRRVRIVTLITQGRLLCNCGYIYRAGKTCHHCYHVTRIIESTDCELFGGIVFIIILERILNIQERQPASSTARNLESPMQPTSKGYTACIQ